MIAADQCGDNAAAFNAAGQLLLKSLTWPELERWCAANGAAVAASVSLLYANAEMRKAVRL